MKKILIILLSLGTCVFSQDKSVDVFESEGNNILGKIILSYKQSPQRTVLATSSLELIYSNYYVDRSRRPLKWVDREFEWISIINLFISLAKEDYYRNSIVQNFTDEHKELIQSFFIHWLSARSAHSNVYSGLCDALQWDRYYLDNKMSAHIVAKLYPNIETVAIEEGEVGWTRTLKLYCRCPLTAEQQVQVINIVNRLEKNLPREISLAIRARLGSHSAEDELIRLFRDKLASFVDYRSKEQFDYILTLIDSLAYVGSKKTASVLVDSLNSPAQIAGGDRCSAAISLRSFIIPKLAFLYPAVDSIFVHDVDAWLRCNGYYNNHFGERKLETHVPEIKESVQLQKFESFIQSSFGNLPWDRKQLWLRMAIRTTAPIINPAFVPQKGVREQIPLGPPPYYIGQNREIIFYPTAKQD